MPAHLDQIRAVVETERERFAVPGCAVVVVKDGGVLLAEGFGKRDVDADLPVTGRTLFPIGSSTKTFTSAVLASLVDEGKLDFDRPLRDYLPGFRMHDPVATELLSVRDCLSHRSGLPRHDALWVACEGLLGRDDIVAALAHLPANKAFRQTWQYNNLLFITAGYLAGRLCGSTYEEAVRARILEPLGMTRTNFDVVETQADPDHSLPYVLPSGETEVKEVPFASLKLAGPAGNINSCAEDLGAWLITLLGQGVSGREPLLSSSVLAELRTPTMTMGAAPEHAIARPVGYGLALVVEEYRGLRLTHHGGNIDGFSSQVLTSPSQGIGIAVLTNLGASPLRDALPYLILDLLDGVVSKPHGERLHTRRAALLQGARQAEEGRAARNKPLGPVRPLADYAGSYVHPGYGTLRVDSVEDGLVGCYGKLPEGPLEHQHLEVYDMVLQVKGVEQRIPMQFTHDLQADVDAVCVSFEPAVPPLRFQRQPDTAHLTDELLSSLEGRYAMGVTSIVVGRRGTSGLVVSIEGQAARALRPVTGCTFSLDGTRLEFAADGRLITPMGDFHHVSAQCVPAETGA